MPVPTPSGVVKIIFEHGMSNVSGGLTSRQFYNYTGPAPSTANCIALATSLATPYGTNLKPLLSTQGILNNITVIDLASTSGLQGTYAAAIVGTRSGVEVEVDTAACVRYLIAQRYRGGKPKGFWPFGTVNDTSDHEHWTTGFQSAVISAFAAFAAAVNGITAGSTVLTTQTGVSYFHGYNAPHIYPNNRAKNNLAARGTPVLYPIVNYACDLKMSQQRKRRP